MKTSLRNLVALLMLLAAAGSANGAALTFDDLPRGRQVGEGYSHLGVHFSFTDSGVQEGLANGDSGAWMVNGTTGPGFVGFNGLAPGSYVMTLMFDIHVTAFCMDASRTFGSSAGDALTATGFLGTTLMDSQTIIFGAINQWSRLDLAGVFDRIEWVAAGSGFHPFGVDNILFTTVPEPSSLALLAGAGAIVAGLLRKRRECCRRG